MRNDLISRQAAIDILYDFAGCIVDTPNGDYRKAYEMSRHKLETVPAAQPKPGKWIPFGSLDLDGNQQYNCSLCHCLEVHTPAAKVSYCWNCGAKMEVE